MAFEPLETDEKLDSPSPREKDTDTVMLFGCGGFVLSSLITYGLAIWPFFVFSDTHILGNLIKASIFGPLPTLLFGAIVTRRFGLSSACGFVGGAMTTAVFLFLRLTEVNLRRNQRDLAQPDYPSSWATIYPVVWLLIAIIVAAVFIRSSEIDVSGAHRD